MTKGERPLEGLHSTNERTTYESGPFVKQNQATRRRRRTALTALGETNSNLHARGNTAAARRPLHLMDAANRLRLNHLNASTADRDMRYQLHRRQLQASADNSITQRGNESTAETLTELETTFDGANGNYGAMFDVSSPEGDHIVTIKELDVHVNLRDPDCPVLIYGHRGTHVGIESSPQNWTLLINTTVQCGGFGSRTRVPLGSSSVVIEAGETYAFYATLPTPNLRYSNGVAVGNVYSATKYLAIHEGSGLPSPFSDQLIEPRVWNGIVRYEVEGPDTVSEGRAESVCDSEISTTFNDNLGSFGNMFDIVTYSSSIDIQGFQFYTDLLMPVEYEIYTKEGSYVDAVFLANWTLVKKGTTNGRGIGRGTAVRNFLDLSVPENSTQAFYVTLTTPDLRYRDVSAELPDAIPGDVYFKNEDMEIQIGVSVGTYPISDTFYGPRLWCGSLEYTAGHGCPSTSPTEQPSLSPSLPPSPFPSSAPTEEDEPYYGNCTATSRLASSTEGGTASYGTMFTVSTLNEPLSITSLEFLAGVDNMISVRVFTKVGDYKGYESDKSAWLKIADASLRSAGNGVRTEIPEDLFSPVHMKSNQTRAFYVTMSEPTLVYSETGVKVGRAFATDKFLQINAGAGVADPLFGTSLYEPRAFNGALHFLHAEDCVATLDTAVTYTFYIQHAPSVTAKEVSDLTSQSVTSTLESVIQEDADFQGYVIGHEFKLGVVSSKAIISSNDTCIAAGPALVCTTVDTEVPFTHKETLKPGVVLYSLLKQQEVLTANLNLVSQFDAQYVGDRPLESQIIVTLEGNFEKELSDEERAYYEEVTEAYLLDQLATMKVNVLGVSVSGQDVVDGKGRRLKSQLNLATTITGEYRPPPDVDFDGVVTDALDAGGGEKYRDDLSSGGRVRPEGLPTFAEIQNSYTERTTTSSPTTALLGSSESGDTNSTLMATVVSVGSVAVLLALGLFCWIRRRQRRSKTATGEIWDHNGGLLDKKTSMFGLGHTKKMTSILQVDAIDAECAYGGTDVPESADLIAKRLAHEANIAGERSTRSIRSLPLDRQLARYNTSRSIKSCVTSPAELYGEDKSFVSERGIGIPSHLHGADRSHRSGFQSSASTLGLTDDSGGRFDDEYLDDVINDHDGHQSRSSVRSYGSSKLKRNLSRKGVSMLIESRELGVNSEGRDRNLGEDYFLKRMNASMPTSIQAEVRPGGKDLQKFHIEQQGRSGYASHPPGPLHRSSPSPGQSLMHQHPSSLNLQLGVENQRHKRDDVGDNDSYMRLHSSMPTSMGADARGRATFHLEPLAPPGDNSKPFPPIRRNGSHSPGPLRRQRSESPGPKHSPGPLV